MSFLKYPAFVIALISLLIIPNDLFSQYAFKKKTHIPVEKNGAQLRFPWTGGFNNPQFSGVDINNDGIKDLVVFDRTGDKVVTFINNGTPGVIDYTHAPAYEKAFYGFSQWMLMDDFDCDGVPDVFTFSKGAADYYKGRFTDDNFIEFDSVTFFGTPSFIGGNIINIFISSIDIAAFVDVNNDGDLDILTFEMLGGTVDYYENQSMELTGTCGDTVLFLLYEDCWGSFYEPSNTNVVNLNACDTCFTPMGGYTAPPSSFYKTEESRAHAGSALLAFDEDGDGDKELILGDISFTALNRLVNCGNPSFACICDQDPTFPTYDKPLKLFYFPAAFYVDVNNDGLRDLLVAPNSKGSSENYNCIWMYENVGREDSVRFQFVTDTFLIDQTLDFGEGAYPAFFDYNADGLLDLIVGNYGYYVNGVVYRSSLALLENVGTPTAPSFKLVDHDYARVSELARKAVYPAFGDMDGDGDLDMIIGDSDGYLHYFENTAGAGNPANFSLAIPFMFDIDVGQFSAPFIYDVNGDSLPDLIVGKRTSNGFNPGVVNYYENIGTESQFLFDKNPTNDGFGNIDVRFQTPTGPFINGYGTPVISRLDSSETLYVLSGSDMGTIHVYEFDRDLIYSGSFNKRFSAYSSIDEGERTAIAIADLNGDGKFEMVVGNYRGGLAFFTQSDTIFTDVASVPANILSLVINIFPNPTDGRIQLRMVNNPAEVNNYRLEFFDMVGKRIWETVIAAQPEQSLDLPPVQPGLYLIRLSGGNHASLNKIFIR